MRSAPAAEQADAAAVLAGPDAGKYRESCWSKLREHAADGSADRTHHLVRGIAARDYGTDPGGSPRATRVSLLSGPRRTQQTPPARHPPHLSQEVRQMEDAPARFTIRPDDYHVPYAGTAE